VQPGFRKFSALLRAHAFRCRLPAKTSTREEIGENWQEAHHFDQDAARSLSVQAIYVPSRTTTRTPASRPRRFATPGNATTNLSRQIVERGIYPGGRAAGQLLSRILDPRIRRCGSTMPVGARGCENRFFQRYKDLSRTSAPFLGIEELSE